MMRQAPEKQLRRIPGVCKGKQWCVQMGDKRFLDSYILHGFKERRFPLIAHMVPKTVSCNMCKARACKALHRTAS